MPRPALAPTNSPTTAPRIASTEATPSPAKRNGKQLGRIIFESRCHSLALQERASSIRSRVLPKPLLPKRFLPKRFLPKSFAATTPLPLCPDKGARPYMDLSDRFRTGSDYCLWDKSGSDRSDSKVKLFARL